MDERLEQGLARIAQRALGGRLEGLRRLSGGASQEMWTFDVRRSADPAVPSGLDVCGFVLRRTPGGGPERASASGLAVEAQVIAAAEAAGVPVAHVAYVLQEADGLGPGFVAERAAGEALGRRIVRDAAFVSVRPRLAADCGAILARIHDLPAAALPLERRDAATCVQRLGEQAAAYGGARPVHALALRWLADNLPSAPRLTVAHGDFRTGNFMLTPSGISAVLDWEGVHVGDPMSDLGWLCTPTWRFGAIDKPVGGFGSREDLFTAYERESGGAVDPAAVRFWEVFGMLRWGLTCALMADEFATTDPSLERGAVGRRTVESEIDLLTALAPRRAA